MRSNSKKPRLRSKGGGMSVPRYPSGKSVEVAVPLRACRDQARRSSAATRSRGSRSTARWGGNRQDVVVAVAEVLNQFRRGFAEDGLPEYAEAFNDALSEHMAKHWPQGT